MRDEDKAKLARRYGKQLPGFLEALARNKHFKSALETPIGQVLLDDATGCLQACVEKVLSEEDTDDTRAEIRAYRKIINIWSQKINEYQTSQSIVNSVRS